MLQLGTKAETLKNLYGKLQNAKVLNSYVFRTKEWKQDAKISGIRYNMNCQVKNGLFEAVP